MKINHFNFSMMTGWVLTSLGSIMLNTGAGIVVSGVLLLVLTIGIAKLAGLRGGN